MKKYVLSMALVSASLLLAEFSAAQKEALQASDYERSIAEWQEQRDASLRGPNSWLNLVGLHWLQAGATSMGSAPDSDILLAEEKAPHKLGVFMLEGEKVTFHAEPGAAVMSDRGPVVELHMRDDEAGEPSRLTHGTLGWHLIQRMGRIGVRLRDYEHPALDAFSGLEFYPVDPAWRVEARFNAYAQPRNPVLTTVVEELDWNPTAPGTLEFELGGEARSLEAYDSEDSFFLIFSDLTKGETTYPSGRYLYADKPGPDGITILDFNKAYSPPCAFTNFATCPLPARQNRLSAVIEAGEKYSKGT